MEIESGKNHRMNKRRELMADGRRYIIYYTFSDNAGESKAETCDRTQSAKTTTENTEIK